MIDEYSGLKYDSFEVIEDDLYGNWFNKFQMYDRFRDGENLYFDLDVCIYNKLPNLIRKDLTVLHAWWRDRAHTSFNSSIISWTGDQSYIYKTFKKDTAMYEKKYNLGIDQMLEENFKVATYDKVCYSIQKNEYEPRDDNYSIVLFNQKQYLMEAGWSGWWTNYFLSK